MAPPRFTLHWILIPLLLSLLALPMFVATARAAQPGEELLRIDNGVLTSSTAFTTVIPSGGVANFRLSVSGGTASDQITLSVRDGSTPVGSWAVRSGETSWGFATIPANATLTLQTASAAPLSYTLGVYARDVAPRFAEGVATWSGTAVGAGMQSAVQINVPAAGRYRFTLGATSGKFQLKVDDNYLLKTVVAGQAPAAEDSTYYLSAGSHTLTVVQSSSETTAWSVALAPVSGPEALPTTENTAVLGAGTFTEEWIPIQVASEQPINIRIAATGAAADKLQVELYHGANRAYASAAVFGGEVAWGTSTVATGANRLRIIADGNTGPLAYAITVSPVGGVPVAWNGVSYGTAHAGGGQPTFQVNFPQAALYNFKLSATAGRFQLVVPGLVRKTASDAGMVEFTAYVPAGPQTLTLVQDPNLASTVWNVEIAATEGTTDALPFSRTGGLIGGTDNAFSEEVLPLQAAAAAPANMKITASGGNPGDSLRFELSNGTTVVYTATSIYNGEVFWATAELARGTNLLRVVANPANTGRMSYQVDVSAIPAIPATLEGVALGPGLNSTVRVNAPVAGIYNISLTITEGTGQVLVNSAQSAVAVAGEMHLANATVTLRVPLTAGIHALTFRQDNAQPRTVWKLETSLRAEGIVPTVSRVTPNSMITSAGATLTLEGRGFEIDTVVELVGSGTTTLRLATTVVSSTQMLATLPPNTANGTYTVRLIQPNGSPVATSATVAVGPRRVFLPLVSR